MTDYGNSERAAFLRGERDAGPRMLGLAILLAIQGVIWFAIGWAARGFF